MSVLHPEKRELTDYVEFNGWLQPNETVEVRARVRGHIQKVHFSDGQIVKKGDALFDLDPRPFEAALEASFTRSLGEQLHAGRLQHAPASRSIRMRTDRDAFTPANKSHFSIV